MSERTYYYARVSSGEQNLDRQLDAFHKLGAEEKYIFTDKASGKNLNRDNYLLLRNNILRPGDTLVIKSLDRLSRNKSDIKNELEFYRKNNIRVKIIDLPTTMTEHSGEEWIIDMVNNLIIEVLSSIAEQERTEIKKRQTEGIEAAKTKGKKFGRPSITPDNWVEVYTRWKRGELKAKEAAELTGIKRSTFYKYVTQYEKKNMKWVTLDDYSNIQESNGASSPINEV
jgi:DNA invertase Pin-like site-specific DNA recombinase